MLPTAGCYWITALPLAVSTTTILARSTAKCATASSTRVEDCCLSHPGDLQAEVGSPDHRMDFMGGWVIPPAADSRRRRGGRDRVQRLVIQTQGCRCGF